MYTCIQYNIYIIYDYYNIYTTYVIITGILLSPLTSIKTYLKMVQECTLEVGHSAIYR